jgi:hypothetical protein
VNLWSMEYMSWSLADTSCSNLNVLLIDILTCLINTPVVDLNLLLIALHFPKRFLDFYLILHMNSF